MIEYRLRQAVSELSASCQRAIGKLSEGYRQAVGGLSASCRRAIGKLSEGYRQAVGGLAASCQRAKKGLGTVKASTKDEYSLNFLSSFTSSLFYKTSMTFLDFLDKP